MSWVGPAKVGCDEGVLLWPYIPLGTKRHKSSTYIGKKAVKKLLAVSDLDVVHFVFSVD